MKKMNLFDEYYVCKKIGVNINFNQMYKDFHGYPPDPEKSFSPTDPLFAGFSFKELRGKYWITNRMAKQEELSLAKHSSFKVFYSIHNKGEIISVSGKLNSNKKLAYIKLSKIMEF